MDAGHPARGVNIPRLNTSRDALDTRLATHWAISCPGPLHVYIECLRLRQAPGHQLATLQLHGSFANIMASMEVFDLMEQQFLAAARNDFMSTGVR